CLQERDGSSTMIGAGRAPMSRLSRPATRRFSSLARADTWLVLGAKVGHAFCCRLFLFTGIVREVVWMRRFHWLADRTLRGFSRWRFAIWSMGLQWAGTIRRRTMLRERPPGRRMAGGIGRRRPSLREDTDRQWRGIARGKFGLRRERTAPTYRAMRARVGSLSTMATGTRSLCRTWLVRADGSGDCAQMPFNGESGTMKSSRQADGLKSNSSGERSDFSLQLERACSWRWQARCISRGGWQAVFCLSVTYRFSA